MNFAEIEEQIVPNDFTGNRLTIIVKQILESWPIIQLAYLYNTSDFTSKSREDLLTKLTKQICSFVINFNTKEEDLEEFLILQADNYFYITIDDESEKFVAKRILNVFEDLEKKSTILFDQIINEIEAFKTLNKPQHQMVDDQNGSKSCSDEEEDQQFPQQQFSMIQENMMEQEEEEEVDEDGFETVVQRNPFGRKY